MEFSSKYVTPVNGPAGFTLAAGASAGFPFSIVLLSSAFTGETIVRVKAADEADTMVGSDGFVLIVNPVLPIADI